MINKMNCKRDFTLFFLLSCAAFLLAACSGSFVEAKNVASVQLAVEGLDTLQFTPDKASIPAESEVELTFKNVGSLDHNFVIMAGEIDPFNLSEADALAGINTGIVPGGEKTTLTFKAPPTGTYTFVCVVPGHAAAGMVGTLTIIGR
ncbi:MAG TPA: plastocyanin/azurin family copper-binding protein [Chloroflexota bacterium]|nr:plastocyanin/azurin family copper-binding protein [Chloroflexota bacterium]HUM67687.1 plastocyanin/azurin family copper-binding protein [Chloroflexota bacterium]